MFRRVSYKIILSIFIVLLGIAVIVKLIDSKKGERTFKSELVKVDADQVTKIQVFPKALGGQSVDLKKEGDKWMVESAGKKYNANSTLPGSMISELNNIKPESVAATKKDLWKQYEVTDSLGTRVKLFNNDKLLTDLIIGKFNYSQNRNMTTYVRLASDKVVYGVNGFLAMTFNRELKEFRDQTVLKSSSSNWTKLTFTDQVDKSFTLSKTENKWYLDGMPADSAQVMKYLSSISRLTNGTFVDNKPTGAHTNTLLIEGNNLTTPIKISGYSQDEKHFIIESNQNEGTYFNSPDLANKIFISRSKLLKQ